MGLQIDILQLLCSKQSACLMVDSLVGRPILAAAAFPRGAKPA
jgi:hypothetical protein